MKLVKNKSGFTLLEVLLSMSLIALFAASMVLSFNTKYNTLEYKTNNYITLTRYTKAYAQLEGKHTKISVNSSNQIQAEIETSVNEYKNLDIVQPQIDDINSEANFSVVPDPLVEEDCPPSEKLGMAPNATTIVIFAPDGSITETHSVIIIPWDQPDLTITNSVTITIDDFFHTSISYSPNNNDTISPSIITTNHEEFVYPE